MQLPRLRPVERDRDRVDGEVASRQVLGQPGRGHVGQRAGTRVGLGPRAGDVVGEAVEPHGRGPEPVVDPDAAAQRLRHCRRVSLDDEVEVDWGSAQQQIPDRAADEVDAGRVLENTEQRPGRRQRADSLIRAPLPGRASTRDLLACRHAESRFAALAAGGARRRGGPATRARWHGGVRPAPRARQRLTSECRVHGSNGNGSAGAAGAAGEAQAAVVNNFAWPWYGYDAGRTRFFPNSASLDPPLHAGWPYNDYGLLEFPPVIYQNTLYLLDDDGWARAINKLNGHMLWENHAGTLAAASPAVGVKDGLVFVPVLSTNPAAGQSQTPGDGRFVALSIRTGRVVWSHPLPAGTESSPIVSRHTLYFGDQNGTVYSLHATNGHVNWTYHASGAVKGGPALADGVLYFGDYAGRAYALNAANGHQIWAVGTNGAPFGFGSGNFYSTPAVAFGRVYMGNTDGRVYSFAARTGALAWATGTGAYVYASPAVQDTPGLGPTVYVGSYDGNFYAFNAQSGAIRWSHPAGGKISGSATIVGDVVYYSDLGTHTTAGLNVRTGQQVFSFRDGDFNPVVADNHAIYLVGSTTVYQMLPTRRVKRPAHHAPPPIKPIAAGRRHTGTGTSA